MTIVTEERKQLFGQIINEDMELNKIGKMVEELWIDIPNHYPNVELGEFVIMPNHFHGIIALTVGARRAVPGTVGEKEGFGKPVSGSVSTIMRSFKSATTKAFHEFPGHADVILRSRRCFSRVS